MKSRILEEAQIELENAFQYYEQILPGLGEKFLDSFQDALSRIQRFPKAWSPMHPNIRKCLLKNFSYNVIYVIEKSNIIILAIAHQHRKPGYWKNRINQS